ncbi:MAG: SsrA-binding protein SmpB [bacterium]
MIIFKQFIIYSMIINRRAKYDYEIIETYEGGLILKGHEVKSIRSGKMSLAGSYIVLRDKGKSKLSEVYLINALISPYQAANTPKDYNEKRSRKILLHKEEIAALIGKIKQKSLTLIPICVYNKRNKIKIEFALAKGKKNIDKREVIKKRDVERDIRREIKN